MSRRTGLGLIGVITALAIVAGVTFSLTRSSAEAGASLSWNALRNASYPSEHPRGKIAPLVDGVYEEEIAPGSATRLRIQLADIAGFGQIDADSSTDTAVVLIASPGGTGTFIHLVAVLNKSEEPLPIASVLLGDRVAVRSLRIENKKVVVGMRVRQASDPFVVLTTEVTRTYSLQDGQLVLESEQAADSPTSPDRLDYSPQRLDVDIGKAAKVEGPIRPGELSTYLMNGQAGQTMRAQLTSQFSNAVLSIQGLDDSEQLVSRSAYLTEWSGILPRSQDYAVTVVSLAGNDLKYALSIELKPAPKATATPVVATRAPTSPASTATRIPTATRTPLPVATLPPGQSSSIPAPIKGQFQPASKPLGTLAPSAVDFLAGRQPSWGASVVRPNEGALYSENGSMQLELASAVKLVIALAIMDAAQRESRYVDSFELSLLWPMMTLSDNDSATRLWDQLGGGRGLRGYLAAVGARGISPYDGPYWGTSTASPDALAILLSRAVFGDLLSSAHRSLLVDLMGKVTPSQMWGVPAAARAPAIVGLKNGWYPAEEGWRVNSVGFISSAATDTHFVVAILTNRQPSWRYGIETIEGAATRLVSSDPGALIRP